MTLFITCLSSQCLSCASTQQAWPPQTIMQSIGRAPSNYLGAAQVMGSTGVDSSTKNLGTRRFTGMLGSNFSKAEVSGSAPSK